MTARIITARNVNEALIAGLWHLRTAGIPQTSRNGPVIVAPGPVITQYARPWERLVSSGKRDANHVFHLMETIWMLAGERDVRWLLQFNSQYGQYAEDNHIQHGAYGHRWRSLFLRDQILDAVQELRKPGNRRVVIGMWHPMHDLGSAAKDVPCNTHIYFQVIDGRLEMTVCCRSNDIIWGAYGANAVHFSMLQELMARELGAKQGSYYQFSNNFHLYVEMGQGRELLDMPPSEDQYATSHKMDRVPLLSPIEPLAMFLRDCELFVRGDMGALNTDFMRKVALPLHDAYLTRKRGEDCTDALWKCIPSDWKEMFIQWKERRDGSK